MSTTVVQSRRGTRRRPKIEHLDITVLAGGPGAEREVSLNSGQAVEDALRRLGHNVERHDIGPGDLSALERPVDIVFIALHGEFGEDGAIQAILEQRGIAYTGSNAAASRQAMDKAAAKNRFVERGIPTPKYEIIDGRSVVGVESRFSVPAVLKPLSSGSSVDTTIVHTPQALRDMATALVERHGRGLVERCIRGPELTVGVLGHQALPVCEIRTRREFYDYQAKYVDDDTQYLFDLDLPPPLIERVQRLSLAAHRALGCRVFSRVDCMIDAATSEPYFLEVNTIPGFTSHSLVPKAAARLGISFDELCQRIIELSLDAA